MNLIARTLKLGPLFATLAGITASCGSSPAWSGGNGSSSGGVGVASGGAGGSAGNGDPSGSSFTGVGSALGGDGGDNFSGVPQLTATGVECSNPKATRICCTNGSQTCVAGGEFSLWGPCVDGTGAQLTCGSVGGCSPGEINTECDGGASSSGGASGGSGGGGSSGGASGSGSGSSGGTPPPPALCTDPSVNTEPGILLAYAPPQGFAVSSNGVIKVWVNDEGAPFVAPGEQVDSTSGLVTAPGNRSATAADGLLYEPALYFAPQTPLNGGTPYFPTWIHGQYNNQPPTVGPVQVSGGMDPLPSGISGRDKYTVEYVWDVSKMNLSPGTYMAVFVIHDGDRDRGIGCVTIVVN